MAPGREPVTAVGLLAAVLLALSACATARPQFLPPPPSELLRQDLGTVAVTVSPLAPTFALAPPAKGAGEGALRGAGVGAGTGVALASSTYYGPIGTILLGPPLALLGALVGAPVGALLAEPGAKVEARETALRRALDRLLIHEVLRDSVLAAGRDRSLHTMVPMPAPASDLGGQPAGPPPLHTEGIGAVLELTVEKFGLDGPWTPNPSLTLLIAIRTRLVRTEDGAELYAHSLTWEGRTHSQEEWAADEAVRLRAEIARACAGLAERVVEEVFLLYFPTPRRVAR